MLFAVVDVNCKFLYVDVGCNGRVSDGGVFKNSSLFTALESKSLKLLSPEPLTSEDFQLSYMLVADDAFPVKENIKKPFGQTGLTRYKQIFNYRLSRVRRVVENSFGILANRFHVFMTPLHLIMRRLKLLFWRVAVSTTFSALKTSPCMLLKIPLMKIPRQTPFLGDW